MIVFAPPGPEIQHELGKRYFWNRTIDWEGYPALPQPKSTRTGNESDEDNELSSPALAAREDSDNELAMITPKSLPRLRSQALGKRRLRNNGDSENSSPESERKRQRVKGEPIVRKFSTPFKAGPKSTRAKNLDENNVLGARRERGLRAHSSSKSWEEQEDGTVARRPQVPGRGQKAAFRSDLAGPSREAETEQRRTLHIERAEYGYRDPTKRPPQFQVYDGYHIGEAQNWIPSWSPHMTRPSRLYRHFPAEHHGAMQAGSFHPQQYRVGDGPSFPWATQNVRFNQGTDPSQPPGPCWQAAAQGEETQVQAHEHARCYHRRGTDNSHDGPYERGHI